MAKTENATDFMTQAEVFRTQMDAAKEEDKVNLLMDFVTSLPIKRRDLVVLLNELGKYCEERALALSCPSNGCRATR